jgi:hypothetical protein
MCVVAQTHFIETTATLRINFKTDTTNHQIQTLQWVFWLLILLDLAFPLGMLGRLRALATTSCKR